MKDQPDDRGGALGRRFEQTTADGLAVVYGDATQQIVLEAVGIKDATHLILTITNQGI